LRHRYQNQSQSYPWHIGNRFQAPSLLQPLASSVIEIRRKEHVKRRTVLNLLEEIPRRTVNKFRALPRFLLESGSDILDSKLKVGCRSDGDLLGCGQLGNLSGCQERDQDQSSNAHVLSLATINDHMPISARNKLRGQIEEVQLGDVMAHVVVRVGDNLIESAITRRSADELKLKKGDTVTAVIKSTEVMIQKD
jgi:molybdopterin-binding protein